jgi:hypothetical protein
MRQRSSRQFHAELLEETWESLPPGACLHGDDPVVLDGPRDIERELHRALGLTARLGLLGGRDPEVDDGGNGTLIRAPSDVI